MRIIGPLRTERPGLARPQIGWRRHSASSSYCPHPSNLSPLTEHSIHKFDFVNPRNLASTLGLDIHPPNPKIWTKDNAPMIASRDMDSDDVDVEAIQNRE